MRPHVPAAAAARLRMLPWLCACCCSPPLHATRPPQAPAAVHARYAAGHAHGDHLCPRSLPMPTNENTYNMKHLLQHTFETDETFGNIRLQRMCIATATYVTSK
jgi:DNA-binding transcriptional LysR family regulator